MKNTIDDGKGERLVDTDIAAMRRFLQDYPKKMVDLDVLQAAFASWGYDRFRPAVAALLDDGSLTDAQGRRADFRNTVVIMTSNLGAASGCRPGSLRRCR